MITAASTRMLRIYHHVTRTHPARLRQQHSKAKPALTPAEARCGKAANFAENSERSVNHGRHSRGRVKREPGMTHVPLGFARRVGIALAGSSGQGWRG